ncbi:MAG: hypothetical protein PUD09_05105, partial [Coriobacteriales bacterium]|nr:hypothetical protein [Coriobacteriales bacterium]
VDRKLQKIQDEPDRLRQELTTIAPTDYEALMAKQAEITQAQKDIEDLETQWLELSDKLGE